MDSYEWHFRLEGEEFDITDITELFGDEVRFTKDEANRSHLVMDLPFTTNDSRAAQDAAEELLAKLNAIAHVTYGNHENIRIGAVGLKEASGAMHAFVHVIGAIRCRLRAHAVGVAIAGPSGPPASQPKPTMIGDGFLIAADKDENLARALYLFGSLPPDWRGLYMVLEAAEDAHGGENGVIARQWVPTGQIKDFKATANSYMALRLAARHGSLKTGIPQAKITLTEARNMMRTILDKWAKTTSQ